MVHFGQRTNLTGWIRTFTDFGRYGVQLFLIVSGFLATKGLIDSKVTYGQYLLKRAIRILPLYIFSIVWFFITETILNGYFHQIPVDDTGLYWWRYIFFLNGFVNSDTYFWSNLGITWTIPLFVWFYLLVPFIVKRIHSIKQAGLWTFAVIIITRLASLVYQCNIFSYFWVFFLGVLSYYAVKDSLFSESSLLYQLIALICVVFNRIEYAYCFLFAGILTLFVGIEKKIHIPIRVIEVIDFIDKRTYTIYLVHGIVFCSLIDRLHIFNISNWQKGIIAIVLSIIGTLIVYQFYENPLQKWLVKKLVHKKEW